MTILGVKPYRDKIALLKLSNGEVSKVNIQFVDAEYEDIIVDIISTNHPEHYLDPNASYAIRVADLISVEESVR